MLDDYKGPNIGVSETDVVVGVKILVKVKDVLLVNFILVSDLPQLINLGGKQVGFVVKIVIKRGDLRSFHLVVLQIEISNELLKTSLEDDVVDLVFIKLKVLDFVVDLTLPAIGIVSSCERMELLVHGKGSIVNFIKKDEVERVFITDIEEGTNCGRNF